MKSRFVFLIILIVFIVFTIQNKVIAQDSTFAFKLNGHKYNQENDLMIRGIQEWFILAMDSLDIPTLIDTLAETNNLILNEIVIPESVEVWYEVDESDSIDFLINITMDTLSMSATGLGCEFEVDIIEAGFIIRGKSDYDNGELKVIFSSPDTLKPEISIVGTGHILCAGIAEIFKTQMEGQIDSLLLNLALMYNSDSFDGPFALLNPIRALGIEDSLVIEQALESFPLEMDLYTEEDPHQEIIQLIIEINFLMGTSENPSEFVGIEPSDINESQLETGGFSFLYWVLQRGFLWHEDWEESQRVDFALSIMENAGLNDYRLELRWGDLQSLVYRGDQLDPVDISPENIDDFIANDDHWDTTAFIAMEKILLNGLNRKLKPFMALGVGHQDRMPLDDTGKKIAPATESWIPHEDYTGIRVNEYLYNLKIYAHATVRKFADDIAVWQIENELNAAGFASAVPEWWRKGDLWQDREFRNQVWQILVTAVRVEDPTALIVHDLHILGFMDALVEWITDIDIVGINYYPNQYASLPVMGFSIGEFVWAVRRALEGLGYGEKPVWLTETGYPAIEIEDPVDDIKLTEDIEYFSESRQQEYVEAALLSAVEQGVNGFFYYSLATQEDFLGNLPTPMRFSGMVRRGIDTFKPALNTYATLYKELLMTTTSLDDGIEIYPIEAILFQNYPNPFNPSTIISYKLSVASNVQLLLYNVQGQLVETIFSGKQKAGSYEIEWNGERLASGIYFYRLNAGNFSDIKKMVFIK